MKLSLFLFSALLFCSCTTPFAINHWAEPQDVRQVPPELIGDWYTASTQGKVDTSGYFRFTEPDSSQVNGKEYPFTFSMDVIHLEKNKTKKDTLFFKGVLYMIDSVLFAELSPVMKDAQLAETLQQTDLYVREKKYILLIRSITRDKIEYKDVDAEDLKRAMAAGKLNIYCSDVSTDDQYFLGRTRDLKKLLSAYVSMQLYKDDLFDTLVRSSVQKK